MKNHPIYNNYIISKDGKIFRNGKALKTYVEQGYEKVQLGGKINVRIHRLVAETYIPNPENKSEVNHLDGNKTNNNDWNLAWVTPSENTIHAEISGLRKKSNEAKMKSVKCINTGKIYPSLKDAQIDTGVGQYNIGRVCKGTRKSAGGFQWEFI